MKGNLALSRGTILPLYALFITSSVAQTQPQQALALNRLGLEAADRRDYPEAERNYRAAVEQYRSLGAAYEAHLSIALFNLAEAICGEGKWRQSEEVFEESLSLSRRSLGPRHARTVAGLNALGHVESMLGDYPRAETRFTEALAITRQEPAREMQAAFALAGLSSLRLRAHKLDEALAYADDALRAAIAGDPAEGVDTALMYQNAARIHRAAGRSERALPLLRKARAIFEKSALNGDPRYAILLSEEGLALMDQGQLGLANSGMTRAIGLLDQCPSCAFELAIARNNLGLLRFRQKKYSEADDLLRKALAAEENYTPRDAPQIQITRDALRQVRTMLR